MTRAAKRSMAASCGSAVASRPDAQRLTVARAWTSIDAVDWREPVRVRTLADADIDKVASWLERTFEGARLRQVRWSGSERAVAITWPSVIDGERTLEVRFLPAPGANAFVVVMAGPRDVPIACAIGAAIAGATNGRVFHSEWGRWGRADEVRKHAANTEARPRPLAEAIPELSPMGSEGWIPATARVARDPEADEVSVSFVRLFEHATLRTVRWSGAERSVVIVWPLLGPGEVTVAVRAEQQEEWRFTAQITSARDLAAACAVVVAIADAADGRALHEDWKRWAPAAEARVFAIRAAEQYWVEFLRGDSDEEPPVPFFEEDDGYDEPDDEEREGAREWETRHEARSAHERAVARFQIELAEMLEDPTGAKLVTWTSPKDERGVARVLNELHDRASPEQLRAVAVAIGPERVTAYASSVAGGHGFQAARIFDSLASCGALANLDDRQRAHIIEAARTWKNTEVFAVLHRLGWLRS